MGKVGLSVCYDTPNFGSQLQVLATVKKIEQLGYEPEIIRYHKKMTARFVVQQIPRLLNPYFVRNKTKSVKKKYYLYKHPEIETKIKVRNRRFKEFASTHFGQFSSWYQGWEELVKKAAENYDIFLCGSDQLWLPSNLGSHFYTLEFAPDDSPKVAYATSFGVSEIPWFQRKRTARYLKRFQALSSREIAGSRIIYELIGEKVPVVCDPTLLFGADDWKRILPQRRMIDEPYLFCYFLGTNEEHRREAKRLQDSLGLKIVCCPFLDHYVECDRNFGDLQLFDLDAADFVGLILHADYVLTDSFHGSVFSVLFHKKFLTFDRFRAGADSRNSRIESLFEILGLEQRRFQGDVLQIGMEIDYVRVEEKLLRLREESVAYLRQVLR